MKGMRNVPNFSLNYYKKTKIKYSFTKSFQFMAK
ncbi:MAG: hypothetical protein K0S44_2660 [Bacteroidetes bacterium]|nr:hypothetical protein [Bacteroidota bacterium]